VLVQVTKDPVGHKGARLTGQVSLPGRFLVYVPDGTTSGISRKLPDTERTRLKTLLKQIVPDTAGVIVRTAAEGASEDELTRDVERLTARWSDIEKKVAAGRAPELLYGEPDLTLKVVRDLFTEDFSKLVVQGDDAWDLVDGYVSHVAPDLRDRLERFDPGDDGADLFAAYRVDEQIAKGLDRKVWLPSGGSLIIDRTEAMTVIDVNTGKFTGSGGNLEETVTKNNLEAAEEIVRQLRLRDIGGIVVIDFIDMVLESNRDLVLRRLTEALARDRTRHQVSEVTSLGLVQLTRKRLGTGLIEAFSTPCPHCGGRGLTLHADPVDSTQATGRKSESGSRRSRRSRKGRADESLVTKLPEHAPGEHPMFKAMAAANGRQDGEPGESEEELVHAAVEAEEESDAQTARQVAREVADEDLLDTDEDDFEDTDEEDTDEEDDVDLDEEEDLGEEDDLDIDEDLDVVDGSDEDDDDSEEAIDEDVDDSVGDSSEASSDQRGGDSPVPAGTVMPPPPRRRRAAARPAGPPIHGD
jgi:ribonuclease E